MPGGFASDVAERVGPALVYVSAVRRLHPHAHRVIQRPKVSLFFAGFRARLSVRSLPSLPEQYRTVSWIRVPCRYHANRGRPGRTGAAALRSQVDRRRRGFKCVSSFYFQDTGPRPLRGQFGVRQKGGYPEPCRSPPPRIPRSPGRHGRFTVCVSLFYVIDGDTGSTGSCNECRVTLVQQGSSLGIACLPLSPLLSRCLCRPTTRAPT